MKFLCEIKTSCQEKERKIPRLKIIYPTSHSKLAHKVCWLLGVLYQSHLSNTTAVVSMMILQCKFCVTRSIFFLLQVDKTGLSSVQFSSVTQSCPTLCDPMNHITPGLSVHHQLLKFTQTHRGGDAIQPSHPLSSPSLPAPKPSQNQGLFQ